MGSMLTLQTTGGGGVTMSSREIADPVEKRHDNVLRTIESLLARGTISLPQLEEMSNDGPGPKMIGQYRIGKRDSYVIVAQLSPEFTARLVDRWQDLEAAAPALAVPQSFAAALRLAAEQRSDALIHHSDSNNVYASHSWAI